MLIPQYLIILISFSAQLKDIKVVREVYDGNGAHEQFALQLEGCLEAGPRYIVIEPAALGDETARWIAVGNCIHKTAVLSAFGVFFSGELNNSITSFILSSLHFSFMIFIPLVAVVKAILILCGVAKYDKMQTILSNRHT